MIERERLVAQAGRVQMAPKSMAIFYGVPHTVLVLVSQDIESWCPSGGGVHRQVPQNSRLAWSNHLPHVLIELGRDPNPVFEGFYIRLNPPHPAPLPFLLA